MNVNPYLSANKVFGFIAGLTLSLTGAHIVQHSPLTHVDVRRAELGCDDFTYPIGSDDTTLYDNPTRVSAYFECAVYERGIDDVIDESLEHQP